MNAHSKMGAVPAGGSTATGNINTNDNRDALKGDKGFCCRLQRKPAE